MNAIFIPSERAGTLEVLVQQLAILTTKRKRQAEFRSLARVVVGLKLVPVGADVLNLACGVNQLGEVGVIVTIAPLERAIISPLPETYL